MTTLKEMALRAGVNISTVSRALNDSKEVGEKTKKRICEIAKEMNYTPNMTAQALVGKGTKEIGVIVPEIGSGYFAELLNSIESELKQKSYSLVVGMTHHSYEEEIGCIKTLTNKKVDGIIVVASMYPELKEYLNKNMLRKLPILLMQTLVYADDYDYIKIDDEYGYIKAIEHLKLKGHKKIGFVADENSSKLRFEMFQSAMNLNQMAIQKKHIKIGKTMFEVGGYEQMNLLLEEEDRPSAVFAAYDQVAIGAMKAIREHGLRIPEDIAVIGYDNIMTSAFLQPALSTISPPVSEMAKQGVRLLLDKIECKENRVIQHIYLKPELIIRETS